MSNKKMSKELVTVRMEGK